MGKVSGKLRIDESMTSEEKRMAIESALLLGIQTESASFPIAGTDGEVPIPKDEKEWKELWKKTAEPVPDEYTAARGNPEPVFDLDFRRKKGLECIFGRGMFLKDEDYDFLPDQLDLKFILPKDADSSVVTAACNFAFRFGMETTGYEGELLADEGYEGNAVVFEEDDCTELLLQEENGSFRILVRGKGKELEEFSSKLCEEFPRTGGWKNWRDLLMDMTDDFILRGADGQVAALAAIKDADSGDYTVYGSPELGEQQMSCFPDVKFENYKAGKKVYEKTYEFPWEVEVFENIVEEEILPVLKSGDNIQIFGAVSEEKTVREKMTEKIRNILEKSGAKLTKAEVICAYKQGFSWIDEIIIPKIKEKKPDKVEIYFKPFLPKGQTEWLDENGATPSYHNLKADDPNKWYDLPIRYLQELYPVEDVLVRELGIERDAVVFLPYEGEEELTYKCRVFSGEEICYEDTYQAQYSERPYLDEYPQMGKVHPSTGYIRVLVNEKELLYRKIKTDLEQVWDVYQMHVLPECRAYVEEKTGGKISADLQPFFQKLDLDVTISEPDYRVGCREDLISSLDALHEDMYFAGSDYFKNYGVQKNDVLLDAPGLILPNIHQKEGRPIFKVTLYEQLKEKPCIEKNGEVVLAQREREDVSLAIRRISFEDGRIGIEIQADGAESEFIKAYAKLLGKGILSVSREIRNVDRIRFRGEDQSVFEVGMEKKEPIRKTKKITEINLHEKELIGYETYLEIIEELKQVPGIEVFRTARSYSGRDLYAIWLKPERQGYLSMTKRLTNCPSEIINARHHANEVSSTNAAFLLLRKLLTEDTYKDLPEKLNLILVPMENVDGAAIHYELQKEHPYWKFHVARFDALGKEFFHDHFKQDTIHSEAMGMSRLYERYLPDMIVDNHGVPSHEWEQQFSGYTSPSYKGFWLPRSLLYGYFWYVTDEEYKDNYPVNKKMEDVIADKIAENEEMTALNKEWSKQFEKYAHAWMPKLFPANYYKNMINYWIPYKMNPEHKYPSIRFPWITTVSYTSEVADETAQGEYLHLCAEAHVAHDEATLQMLMNARLLHECKCQCTEKGISVRYQRYRPMLV